MQAQFHAHCARRGMFYLEPLNGIVLLEWAPDWCPLFIYNPSSPHSSKLQVSEGSLQAVFQRPAGIFLGSQMLARVCKRHGSMVIPSLRGLKSCVGLVWNTGILRCWKFGMLYHWIIRILISYYSHMLEYYNIGCDNRLLGCWNIGILGCWSGTQTFLLSSQHLNSEPGKYSFVHLYLPSLCPKPPRIRGKNNLSHKQPLSKWLSLND